MFDRVIKAGEKLGLSQWVRPSGHDPIYADLIAAAKIGAGEAVLDLECGEGELLRLLRPVLPSRGARYTGVDREAAHLDACREIARVNACAGQTELVSPASLSALPLKSGTFDVVFVHFTLFRLEANVRSGLLREVSRLLGKSGRLFVLEPSRSYDAGEIVRRAKARDELRHLPPAVGAFNGLVGYRLLALVEGQTARRIRRNVWHGFSPEELEGELRAAGFAVDRALRPEDGLLSVVHARRPA